VDGKNHAGVEVEILSRGNLKACKSGSKGIKAVTPGRRIIGAER